MVKSKKQVKIKAFRRNFKFSIKQLVIFAVLFSIFGTYLIYKSVASTPVLAVLESEQMQLPAGSSIITDATASGGKVVKVTANGTATANISLSANASSLQLKAKGTKCKGRWPGVNIKSDATTILSTTSVSSSSWKQYISGGITSGTHNLSFSFSNMSSCRPLYLDVVTIYAQVATTQPTPTPTPTEPTPTTSTTPIANSIYWGSWIDGDSYGGSSSGRGDAPWDTTTWNLFESHAGKKVSILHYGQPPMWEQQFASGPANIITGRGAIPMMDMSSKSVPLADIAAGKYDSSITSWAQSVKAWGKPFFFRWNWEMNGTWFSWGAQAKQSPSTYVAAWKHIHDVVNAQGATNVTWVWCPNTTFTGSTPLSQLYPGGSYVDWTCVDGYNSGTSGGKADSWRSFSTVIQPTYNELLSIASTKPIMIGETASNEGGGTKSAWVSDTLSSQLPVNFPKVKAFVWFNWPIYENGVNQQWPIESSQASQDAFKAAISSAYYAPGSFGNLQPLSKVAPL